MIKELLEIAGRTFIVGDIHGCYDKFLDELEKVNFDFDNDRVISVGDLVDRGPDNMKCLRLLHSHWFHAVRGNHDELVIGSIMGYSAYRNCWMQNGGDWSLTLSYEEREELYGPLLDKLNELPYIIKVGNVAILHAECTAATLEELDLEDVQMLTWGRTITSSGIAGIVGGIDHIVVGHSVVPKPVRVGNHVFIDTGAVFGSSCNVGNGGYLTLINIDDVPSVKEAT